MASLDAISLLQNQRHMVSSIRSTGSGFDYSIATSNTAFFPSSHSVEDFMSSATLVAQPQLVLIGQIKDIKFGFICHHCNKYAFYLTKYNKKDTKLLGRYTVYTGTLRPQEGEAFFCQFCQKALSLQQNWKQFIVKLPHDIIEEIIKKEETCQTQK